MTFCVERKGYRKGGGELKWVDVYKYQFLEP